MGKLSLEAVSTKIDTIRPTQKSDRCLKFQNDLNLPVFCCIVILKTDYAAFNLSITALFCFTLCLFIILLVRFGLLSGYLLGNSCPLGWPCVLIVFCLFVFSYLFPIFVIRAGLRF